MKKLKIFIILILVAGLFGCHKLFYTGDEYLEKMLGSDFIGYIQGHYGYGENKKYTVVANKPLSSFPNEDVVINPQSCFPDADIVFNIYEDDEFLFGSAIKYSKENDVGQGTTFKYGDGYCIILGYSFEEEKFESEFQFDITDRVVGNDIKEVKLVAEADSEINDYNWIKDYYKEIKLKEMPSGLTGKVVKIFDVEINNGVMKVIHKKDKNEYCIFENGNLFLVFDSDGSNDFYKYRIRWENDYEWIAEQLVLLCKENYNFVLAGAYISDNDEYNYENILKDKIPYISHYHKKCVKPVVDYLKDNPNKEFVLD